MADLTANLAGIISPNPFGWVPDLPQIPMGRLLELLIMVGVGQSGKLLENLSPMLQSLWRVG